MALTPDEAPSTPFLKNDVAPVRIMLQSGIHPEYMSLLDVYHLMEQVCNNWASSPFLEALRWGCDILVMPVISPWSINNDKLGCDLFDVVEHKSRPNRYSRHTRSVPLGKCYPSAFACYHLVLEYPGQTRSGRAGAA